MMCEIWICSPALDDCHQMLLYLIRMNEFFSVHSSWSCLCSTYETRVSLKGWLWSMRFISGASPTYVLNWSNHLLYSRVKRLLCLTKLSALVWTLSEGISTTLSYHDFISFVLIYWIQVIYNDRRSNYYSRSWVFKSNDLADAWNV